MVKSPLKGHDNPSAHRIAVETHRHPNLVQEKHLANEGQLPQDSFHLWVFLSENTTTTAHECGIFSFFKCLQKATQTLGKTPGARESRVLQGKSLSPCCAEPRGRGTSSCPSGHEVDIPKALIWGSFTHEERSIQ